MKYTFIISAFFAISCTNMFSQNISQTDYISNPIIKNGDIFFKEEEFYKLKYFSTVVYMVPRA